MFVLTKNIINIQQIAIASSVPAPSKTLTLVIENNTVYAIPKEGCFVIANAAHNSNGINPIISFTLIMIGDITITSAKRPPIKLIIKTRFLIDFSLIY